MPSIGTLLRYNLIVGSGEIDIVVALVLGSVKTIVLGRLFRAWVLGSVKASVLA